MNKFKITIDGNNFEVTVDVTDHNKANVEVNGISYEVKYENKAAAAPVVLKATAPAAPQVQVTVPQAACTGASIKAPLPGTVTAIKVAAGDQVKRGDTLLVMEAMKMENNIMADKDGRVKAIRVTEGQSVAQDDLLIELE